MLPLKRLQILLKTDFNLLKCPVRGKKGGGHGPDHWSVLRRTKFPKDRALEHFDDFYANVYGERKWSSMRLALLCDKKYCAVVNSYSNMDQIMTTLENKGAVNVRKVIQIQAEKLAEENNVTYLEQPKVNTVYKLDAKMNRITASLMEREAQKLFPELPDDVAKNYIQNAKNEIAAVDSSKQPSKHIEAPPVDDHDNFLPSVNEAGNLEITEDEINSRLVRATDALHDFVPTTKLKGLEAFIPESQHYSYYKSESEFPILISEDGPLNFPPYLNVYTYETGNITNFKQPKRGAADVLDYFLLDGSSLFPVLALNLQPDDRILDLCAAPGGKSLLMLQTLYPRFLTCNDRSETRMKRLRWILKDYFYDIDDKVSISVCDGAIFKEEPNFYNKILVDVPCTTDRLSLKDNDDNFFSPSRVQERLQLPEQQAALLSNALQLVALGGTVVYSTCSLSPIQNDGVVYMALKKIWEETDLQFVVKDMSKALEPAKILFPLETKMDLKYGFLVCPFLPANFGPMYFCKLVRVK